MKLLVCPLHDVAQVLEIERPSHVVSLLSPGAEAPDCPSVKASQRLSLFFNDINADRDSLQPPSPNDVAALLSFGARCDGGVLLVHCWAGVSRSPAAAFVLACQATPAGEEARIAANLRRAAPYATPNALIVSLADDLLGRGGAMTRAVAAIGRGADTAMGAAFTLDYR